jgi:hypothetical protein
VLQRALLLLFIQIPAVVIEVVRRTMMQLSWSLVIAIMVQKMPELVSA